MNPWNVCWATRIELTNVRLDAAVDLYTILAGVGGVNDGWESLRVLVVVLRFHSLDAP